LLLSRNAFVDATDNNNATPLFLACSSLQFDMIITLINNGANLTISSRSQTPLQILGLKFGLPQSIREVSLSPSTVSFAKYMKNSNLSDCTFIVEGKTFHAHKIILCAQSEVFSKMLESNYWKKEESTEIKDTSAQAFEQLLEYFYTGSISLSHDVNRCLEVLELSLRFMVYHLASYCEYILSKEIEASIASPLYHILSYEGGETTQKFVAQWILNHYDEIIDNDKSLLLSIITNIQK